MKSAGVRTPRPEAETKTPSRPPAQKGSELTGGPFDFFRKYQRPILYTAGIFALVSFSISGALLGFFDNLFHSGTRGPALTLSDGRRVHVLEEDFAVGRELHNRGLSGVVALPPLGDGERDEIHQLAVLRRLAVGYGFELSTTEADKAIAQAVKVLGVEGPADLARSYTSVEGFRRSVAEALRISNYVRLLALTADTTDAALSEKLLRDKEMLTLTVASLSKKALSEDVEKQVPADEELMKWLAALPDAEKAPFQDENHVALTAAGLLYDKFDPAAFAEELKGVEITDERIQQRYTEDKERLYRREPPPAASGGAQSGDKQDGDKQGGENQGGGAQSGGAQGGEKQGGDGKGGPRVHDVPAQDPGPGAPAAQAPQGRQGEQGAPQGQPQGEQGGNAQSGTAEGAQGDAGGAAGQAPKDTAKPEVQGPPPDPYIPLEEVKDQIRRKLQAEAVLKSLLVDVQLDLAAWMREVVEARNQAAQAVAEAKKQRDEAQQKADQNAADEASKKALEEAKQALETKEQALKAADEAVTERRKAFDLVAAMGKAMKGRPGLGSATIGEPKPPEELRDLGELGTWMETYQATSVTTEGELSTVLQRTPKAAFHFQVKDILPRPMRPFEEIRDRVRTSWVQHRVDEIAKEKTEAFEKRLLELGKEARKDEVAKVVADKDTAVAERLEAWKKKTSDALAEAQKNLQALADDKGSRIHATWAARVAKLEQELQEKAAEREKEIRSELDAEYDKKIDAVARKAYGEVLAQAAEGSGFEVREIGPYPTDLQRQPRYDQRWPEDVRFLFRNADVTKLQPGDATAVLEDVAGRAAYVVVAKSRDKATLDAISRRELWMARDGFENERLVGAIVQSFSRDAFEKRIGLDAEPKVSSVQ